MSSTPYIDQMPLDAIARFCRKWGIDEFAVFGSALGDQFGADSDVDILVCFGDDTRYTLFDLVLMGEELELLLGRRVDLLDRRAVEASANPFRRESILSSAKVVYAA